MEHRPLKDLRAALNLTQGDVATVAEVTKGRVSQVESGDGNFSVDTWLVIYDHWRTTFAGLGYTLEDLLRGGERNSNGASAA